LIAGGARLDPGPGYFSVNSGQTNLGTYNNPRNGGDAADWISTLVGDPYGSGYGGVPEIVSPPDVIEDSVLGYKKTATALNYTNSGACVSSSFTGPPDDSFGHRSS
jgi:hypothetical protein